MSDNHIKQQLRSRNVSIPLHVIYKWAMACKQDTAVICKRGKLGNEVHGESEVLIVIVRDRKPITAMYRRERQRITKDSLRVNHIADITR